MRTIAVVITSLLAASGLSGCVGDQTAAPPTASRPLPENPCDLLTAAELAEITGLAVTSVRRVPSIKEVVSAEREGRKPEPGRICSFETDSQFGAISLVVPRRSERGNERYWEARSKYFETYPGSAKHIPGLGMDAWLAGGTSLSVLVREQEYVMLSTQQYHRESREVLVAVARALAQR
jgi:hypothetical protein